MSFFHQTHTHTHTDRYRHTHTDRYRHTHTHANTQTHTHTFVPSLFGTKFLVSNSSLSFQQKKNRNPNEKVKFD